ncbi:MAG: NAD-dependent epimerase/dehydratase family protein, partial [Candidatus Thiodiazotropha sp. (ex Lucina pensylvanica)]|nr:NAD-dependent epimerase/dehydratase family protein [Candidatus Thiodiazotropha sp. (ex Lucina pensylvanica)]
MNIAISGSTGFIGTHLSRMLRNQGHTVIPVGRRDFNSGTRHLSTQECRDAQDAKRDIPVPLS